jgi:hypothetical protein
MAISQNRALRDNFGSDQSPDTTSGQVPCRSVPTVQLDAFGVSLWPILGHVPHPNDNIWGSMKRSQVVATAPGHYVCFPSVSPGLV